jgi:hypothetical protein
MPSFEEEPVEFVVQRRAERFPVIPPIDALAEPIGAVALVDISCRGARLRHPGAAAAGTPVRLRFRPAGVAIPLTFHGVVVWCRTIDPDDSTSSYSGISFDASAIALSTVIDRLFRHAAGIPVPQQGV